MLFCQLNLHVHNIPKCHVVSRWGTDVKLKYKTITRGTTEDGLSGQCVRISEIITFCFVVCYIVYDVEAIFHLLKASSHIDESA